MSYRVVARVVWGALIVLAVYPPKLLGQQSAAEIASHANPATVTILALSATGDTLGQGSGFVISPDGVVVTNWHVIESADRVVVRLASGELYDRVQYLDALPDADVALIQIAGFSLDHLEGTSVVPNPGDPVVVIGSPLGLSNTVSDGIVSAVRMLGGKQILQITAPISPGSSGGPVLDQQGRVVGIATAYLPEGQGLNFAVPVRYALGLLNLDPAPKPFPGKGAAPSRAPTTGRPVTARSIRSDLTGVYLGYLNANQWWITIIYPETKPPADEVVTITGDSARVQGIVQGALLATRDGRVAITFPFKDRDDWILEGYQTASGIFLEAKYFGPAGSSGLHLKPHDLPLTSWIGLYRVNCRTEYRSGSYYGGVTNWHGFGVLGPTEQYGFITFGVENDVGGTTGFSARFEQPNGRTLRVASGDRSQSLSGNWPPAGGIWEYGFTDRRDEGAYDGRCDWRKF